MGKIIVPGVPQVNDKFNREDFIFGHFNNFERAIQQEHYPETYTFDMFMEASLKALNLREAEVKGQLLACQLSKHEYNIALHAQELARQAIHWFNALSPEAKLKVIEEKERTKYTKRDLKDRFEVIKEELSKKELF